MDVETVCTASGRTATRARGHYTATGVTYVTYGCGAAVQTAPPRRTEPSAADRALAAWMRAQLGGALTLAALARRTRQTKADTMAQLARMAEAGLVRQIPHPRFGEPLWVALPQETHR